MIAEQSGHSACIPNTNRQAPQAHHPDNGPTPGFALSSSENPKAEKAPSKAKPPRLDEDGEKMLSIEEAFPNMHPGSILRGFRFRDEMTQQDLADKLKINQSRVSELENGSRAITKTMAARLAKLFGTSYRVFL